MAEIIEVAAVPTFVTRAAETSMGFLPGATGFHSFLFRLFWETK
jgi:hypothetical protein